MKYHLKIRSLKTWLFITICAPIIICAILAIANLVAGIVTIAVGNWLGKRHILNANHTELLCASRQMIAKYKQYTNEWAMTSSLVDGEKALSFWDINNGYRYKTDQRLPEAVREMSPRYVVVGTNYLYIMPKYPERSCIVAYYEGVSTNTVPRFRGVKTLLTNDLWFCW